MEFVVRRTLKQQEATLAELARKDNPRRATATPTAERLKLSDHADPGAVAQSDRRNSHTLAVQEQILGLGLPADLYAAR